MLLIFGNVQVEAASTVLNWEASTTDYSSPLQSLVNVANHGDSIQFESGKSYPFTKGIDVKKGVVFSSTDTEKAVLRMDASCVYFFELTQDLDVDKRVTFINLEIDGNANVTKAATSKYDACLVHSYGRKISIKECILRDAENGIRGKVGFALHGLKVENSDFYEINNICILILNRSTSKSRIEALTEKVEIVSNSFHAGFQRGIICDCGNDFYDVDFPGVTDAMKRYNYVTDLKGTFIHDNDFTGWNKWCIGFVQAKNAQIDGNRMTNQASTAQSYNATLHFEQFVSDITVSNNVMTNNTTGAKSFIDLAGGEAKRRYQNTPEMILRDLKDGSDGTCGPGAIDSNEPDKLSCSVHPHTYGQRRIYIYGNTFSTNADVQLEFAIAMHEVEDFYIGRTKDEIIEPNTWNLANAPTKAYLKIVKFDKGVCGVKINDPRSVSVIYQIVYTDASKLDVSMDASEDCILFNPAEGATGISESDEAEDHLLLHPNPTKDYLTVSTSNTGAFILEVYNLMGALIHKVAVAESQQDYVLKVDGMQNGLYVLKCIKDNGISAERFRVLR